ncbi:hypothetical protein CRG98_021300 [Punica granatum]|uniref:Uncharacterized protein n=1 Tax=Punica granatum TaxID=22663 RepID=A0A2I0JPS3_PUNGR|nr:hypothetical protein CRG98_021300 [Punica granatum]
MVALTPATTILGEVAGDHDMGSGGRHQSPTGFICIYSVASGSAAECAGLGYLHEEANAKGHLLMISRLEGKSVMPLSVCSSRLINCCDHNEIRDVLTEAIERMEGIRIQIMVWPNQTRSASPRGMVSTLWPPSGIAPTLPL